MSIGKLDDAPVYDPVRPFVSAEQLAALDSACAAFDQARRELQHAAADADRAVSLTLGWVRVGQQLTALLGTVLRRHASASDAGAAAPAESPQSPLAVFGTRMAELADLAHRIAAEVPAARPT